MPPDNENVLQKLAPSIVEIISDKDSSTLGTGFVITDDGLIVTCRHVITDDDKLMNKVRARFYSDFEAAGGNRRANVENIPKYTMYLVKEYTRDPSVDPVDIAFFRLDVNSLPEQNKKLVPVELDDKIVSLNDFVSIGFRKADELTGLIAMGDIGIPTNIKSEEGLLSPQVIQLYHRKQIEPGMSGAPVFDVKRIRVVGIITERYIPTNFTDEDTLAFALPVKSMIELYPNLREKNQGLTVLSKFLRAIGEEGSSIYKWIEEVYVPPIEYEEIKAALKRDRIVFITGTKEFGKTFTAVKLMYEFFKGEGYQPRWVKERKEPGREGVDPQELMKFVEKEGYTKPHQIVYFEDPFGKTRYERSVDLENYIGSIIDSIKTIEDAYVIITSREEVFKKFEREQLSELELDNFEQKMNLKRASYSMEKKKQMLYKWAKAYNCKWLLDSALTKLVLSSIENQKLLPTPLNVKDFVVVSGGILDSNQLTDLINKKSEETVRRFADEIMRMEDDEKVAFLAIAFSSKIDVNFVEEMFDSIASELKPYSMSFKDLLEWFQGDKINVSEHKLAFSHPSYEEAFEYALNSKKSDSIRIRHIFSNLFIKLLEKDKKDIVLSAVLNLVWRKFVRLPSETRETLLLKLIDFMHGRVATALIYISLIVLHWNFDELSKQFIERFLFKVVDIYGTVKRIGPKGDNFGQFFYGIEDNFDKLSKEFREQLLLKLVEKHDETALEAYYMIERSLYDKLSEEFRGQLLLKLAEKDGAAKIVSSRLEDQKDYIPQRIRNEILTKFKEKGVR